jgi:DNA-binding response OmpR family regulator
MAPVAWFTDDDEDMTRAVRLMLHLLGYEMRSFYNARSTARTLLAGEQPDILLLDIHLPEVTGIDLLEFVRRRSNWDHLPIIMLTSEATEIQIDQALALGADAYVMKPVTIDELDGAIKHAVSNRRVLPGKREQGPDKQEKNDK